MKINIKILIFVFIIPTIFLGCSTASNTEDYKKNWKSHFVKFDEFTKITKNMSLSEVRNLIGKTMRHQFTTLDNGHTVMLFRCFFDTGKEQSYRFYQLLFQDKKLIKIIPPTRHPKIWDIEDTTIIENVIKCNEITFDKIKEEIIEAEKTMKKYSGNGNIPQVVGYLFGIGISEKAKNDYPINEELLKKFDGSLINIGIENETVDETYGKPLYIFKTRNNQQVRIYGDDRYLGSAVDSFLMYPYTAVLFDTNNKVLTVYSDYFFCKDWYPNLPKWRK